MARGAGVTNPLAFTRERREVYTEIRRTPLMRVDPAGGDGLPSVPERVKLGRDPKWAEDPE